MSVEPSGSFAKGTAVRSGTDIDLFISLSFNTPETLKGIYNTLFAALSNSALQPRRQDVSIGIRIASAYDVDLVPARKQGLLGNDHSLYSARRDTWMQTNVTKHIALIQTCGRLDEIRLMKIWRNRRHLDFPSFFLELATIRALAGRRPALSNNVVATLEFLRDHLRNVRIVDPANTNNVVSDTLSDAAKQAVAVAARAALASTWENEFT